MPGKKVAEAVREREVFRYDSTLLSSIHNDPENPIPSSQLRASSDSSLTALAQVAVLRLNASRALISLFDEQRQHVIAEATPSLRISADAVSPDKPDDELWLCGTSIPRSSSICEHVLVPQDLVAVPRVRTETSLPVTIVDDLENETFREKRKSLYQSLPYHRFYAGVPIRSSRGINIGVFCIFDYRPRSGLDEVSITLMQDMSTAILKHLELRRSSQGRRPGERMLRGLGSYVEGKATMSGLDNSVSNGYDTTKEGSLNKDQQEAQQQQEEYFSVSGTDLTEPGTTWASPILGTASAGPTTTGNVQDEGTHSTSSSEEHRGLSGVSEEESREFQLQRIFSRAANIIRESTEVEGTLFLDASIASFGGSLGNRHKRHNQPIEGQSSVPRASSTGDEAPNISKSPCNVDVAEDMCTVLGFSDTHLSSIDDARPQVIHQSVPEPFLQKLLRRYPRGKIFNFDANGSIIMSESSSEEPTAAGTSQSQQDVAPKRNDGHQKQRKDPFFRQRESKAIMNLFPGARSVCFVPLWDSHRQRWFAGGFLYTMTPSRVFTIQGDLSYLSAFSSVIMADVAMVDSSLVTTATTSLLSSLSHELRSPLHGVVLCTELLRDTLLDVFQGDMLRSIETSSRTLLDTINHLLDWTRINNFVTGSSHSSSSKRGLDSSRRHSMTDGMMLRTSSVDFDMLVEEVVECIHNSHTYQQQFVMNLQDQLSPNELDSHHDSGVKNGSKVRSSALHPTEAVIVLLDIDPTVDWVFQAQAGALRRIIMNICGNALKFTDRGFVKISAYQEPENCLVSETRVVHIDIVDTGPGIGEEFLNHKLFAPFSQENTHIPGTGLGLSIVRKLSRALGGSVHVESKMQKGTKVSVKLPLQVPKAHSIEKGPDLTEFNAQVTEVSGLRVSILGFSTTALSESSKPWAHGEFDERALLENTCRDWLQMVIVGSSRNTDFLPDLVLCDEAQLALLDENTRSELSTPIVVVCRNAAVARELERSHRSLYKTTLGLFSFISRPVAPRKLARAFILCFRQRNRLKAATEDSWSVSTSLERSSLAPDMQPSSISPGQNNSEGGYFDISLGSLSGSTSVQPQVDDVQTPIPLGSFSPTSPSRFLLVEDNLINMKILQTYMKKLSRRFDVAANGQEAVYAYQNCNGQYQCILMDISMPVMDGFEATRLIRRFEKERELPHRPIFAISGLASKDAQAEGFAIGLDLFLSKPVKLKELSEILRSHGIIK